MKVLTNACLAKHHVQINLVVKKTYTKLVGYVIK